MRFLIPLLLVTAATPALADPVDPDIRESRTARFEARREARAERVAPPPRVERPERPASPSVSFDRPERRFEGRPAGADGGQRWRGPRPDAPRPFPTDAGGPGARPTGDSVADWRWRDRRGGGAGAGNQPQPQSQPPVPTGTDHDRRAGDRWLGRDGRRDGAGWSGRTGREDGRWQGRDGRRDGTGWTGPTGRNDVRWQGRDGRRDGTGWTGRNDGRWQGRDGWTGRPTQSGAWRPDWRRDPRYDWQRYRDRNRSNFRVGIYLDPFGWGYRPVNIGWQLQPNYYAQQYWLGDPSYYSLPVVGWPYQWVRYYDDALLVDVRDGRVVDVINEFFW